MTTSGIRGYTDNGHYHVAVEQADGLFSLERNGAAANRGDAGDPYPGSDNVRSFNETSLPNSLPYVGGSTNVTITNVSDSGPTMTANINLGSGGGRRRRPRPRGAR